jgi:lipopolysaccharide/colanic/teichoic acid biosynthesis glycosyltransferase
MRFKRLFDLCLAIPGAVIVSPVLLGIAAWVKWDSPGPVLFRQVRVGRGGRPFKVLKFRTMLAGAEGKGPPITIGSDPRITRCGAFIRKHKLDELPQLFNVIKGEMSLVGPRPEVPEYVALYPPEVRDVVLSVPPGVTDLASIEFKDESILLAASEDPRRTYIAEILPRKLDLYVSYVGKRSLSLDVQVIAKTIRAIIT